MILAKRHPEWPWPAASTAGEILERHGLVSPRRRSKRVQPAGRPHLEADSPNDLWTCDFKGQFRTGDRRYCYPLTIADHFSRYLLGCQGQLSTATAGTRAVFERLFRETPPRSLGSTPAGRVLRTRAAQLPRSGTASRVSRPL